MQVTLTVDQVKLHALQRRLREAGERGLVRELNAGLKRAAEPLAEAERQAALALPPAGVTPLSQDIADSVKVRITRSQRNPGARVMVKSRLARASTARFWRHPVWGNRHNWVTQTLSPGWWGRTGLAKREQARVQIRRSIETVSHKIAG